MILVMTSHIAFLYVVVTGVYLDSCGGDIGSQLIVFIPAANIAMQYVCLVC